MTDFPRGEFSAILVGAYWPSITSVMATITAAQRRNVIQVMFDDYVSVLRTTRTGPLANMLGITADNTHSAFKGGEAHAEGIVDKNGIKKQAFADAADALNGLRSDLTQIAADGNQDIHAILQSKGPDKLPKIMQVVMEKNQQASLKALLYGNTILNGIQNILSAEGDARTPEEFAKDNGIYLPRPTSPTEGEIRAAVERTADLTPPTSQQPTRDGAYGAQASTTTPKPPNPTPQQSTPDGNYATHSPAATTATPTHLAPSAPYKSTPAQAASTGGTPAIQAAAAPGLAQATTRAGLAAAPATGAPSAPTAPAVQSLTPQNLADSFTLGMQTNNPLTTFGESFTHTAASPTITHHPEFSTPTGTVAPATLPSSGGFYGGESASAVAAAQSPAMTTAAAPSPTMIAAAPVPAAPSMTAGPPPMAPPGPLPTYGSDLRPAAAVISTPTATPPPLAGAPLTAPVNPAGTAGGITQPAVVSKPTASTASSAPSPAAGVAENAFAATTSGAAAGAASAHRAAQSRLLRLVEAVARQQPRLRWAIGERDDGTTVLVTDLSCGWIPPGVEIPVGIHLLPPARRRGGLEALLGDTAIIETWAPGQYLPPAADAEPVPMSLRARDLPAVDDLNWQLTQTTNRRDGLPRLAHTLTKAGIAATGIPDEESELLREHLRSTSEAVLGSYADRIDTDDVGNWQLLTAIEALVTGQKTALNYHFAWYQALNTAKQGYPS